MVELSLDLKPIATAYVPESISLFLKQVSRISSVEEKLDKVDAYVKSLEEERNKIDAFKRELPLCMVLLNDAIGALNCERMQWKKNVAVPFKGNEKDLRDKKSWMSSVQLWSVNGFSKTDDKEKLVEEVGKVDDLSPISNEKIFSRYGGGAFVPFKGISSFQTRKEEKEKEKEQEEGIQLESGLSLGIKKQRIEPSSCLVNSKSFGCGSGGIREIPSPSIENTHSSVPMPIQSQAPRKQRRCWSADLHRRFLAALQQLGGAQVATPKQIRELIKVDGLTNDEVKSHLQKYRLHTRRYPANASASAHSNENKKLVLFGGLWVPEDQCESSKTSTSESKSPQGPLQLMGTSGGTSTTVGNSMDDEDDEKSESHNWKGQFHKPGEEDA